MLGNLAGKLAKPQIQKQLKKAAEKFDKEGRLFTSLIDLECVKALPELQNTLIKLKNTETQLYQEISSDAILTAASKIVGAHLKDLMSKAKDSATVAELTDFAFSLLDIKHYSKLNKLLLNAETIDTLSKEDQDAVLSGLTDGNLVAQINEENAKINIEETKKTFEGIINKFSNEFKLSANETKVVLDYFHGLTDRYLSTFEGIRQELLKDLPILLQMEHEKALSKCQFGTVDLKSSTMLPNLDKTKKEAKDKTTTAHEESVDNKKKHTAKK